MAEGKGPDSKKVVTSSRITDFFSTSNEKCQPTATSAHSGTSASTTKSSTAGSTRARRRRGRPKIISTNSDKTSASSAQSATQPSHPRTQSPLLNNEETDLAVTKKGSTKEPPLQNNEETDLAVTKKGSTKQPPLLNIEETDLAVTKKGSTSTKNKAETSKLVEQQKSITDFFSVRRSDRRLTSKELRNVKDKELQDKLLSGCEEGLEVVAIEGKGRGVVAARDFQKNEFVVEYAGDLVTIKSAKEREALYAKDESVGCYMYYFVYKNKQYCIDATEETGKLGRLLNHSRKGNCHTKVVGVNEHPYLILVASRNIKKGEELTYDYGDRSQTAIQSYPWLKD